ncbi:proteoglycan 4-like [Anopheles merus]|uniref:RanBP2-type domain-containing protein n=1 Tax=Anopheles merus TaxID=30066 RepID=A0A182V6A0_ANOME|nr:proteoglycan 4-like [Anopheles merus]
MPHGDSTSPRTGGRVEECGGEHSDEKDEETPSPSGWKNVSEDSIDGRKNVSSVSNINNSSSSSIYHNEESFVDKIRSNFSCMFSKLLPFRLSKDVIESSHNQQEVRRLSRSLATQTPEELGQVVHHSQNVPESNEFNNNKSLLCETAAKRRRLCESEGKTCDVPEPPKTLGRFNTVPAVQNRRLTGFLGNAHYRKRMQQQRHHGNIHKPLFGTPHLQPTRGRNDSFASSQRPSFKPSITAVAKSLTTGYIPPEYGGSPFYEGFTRYGGASAAQMLARYDPNSTAVTTLIRRKIPTENGSASSSRGSTVPYPSQRILAIVDKYATNRSDRTAAHSKATLCKSRSLPMVQPMRVPKREHSQETEQQLQRPLPPIVPLMEYTLPVQLGLQPPVPISPIERNKQSTPTGGKQTTKRTRIHAKPVKEPQLSKIQPVQLPNVQLPPLIKGLPQFDNIVPLKGRTLPVADNVREFKPNASDKETSVRKHDQKQTPPEKTESSTASTLLREINTFVFARPQLLGSWPPQLQDDPFPAATMKFKFAEPEPLHDDQPPVRSFKDLMADSGNRWACEVCMVRNEPHKKTCIACNSSMPKSKESKPKESKSSKESKPRESKAKESKPKESKAKESKSIELKSKESVSKELKSKDSKPKESKPKESNPKESKSKESKSKESKPKESKPKESKPKESKPKESQPKESKPKEPKPEEPKPKESKPKESKPKESQPKESKPNEPKPEEPKPEEPKPEEPKQHRSSRNTANTSKTTSSVTTNDSEPSKRWKCTACKVRNEPTVSICVSCAKKKSSSSSSRTNDRKDRSHKKESKPPTTEKTKP